MLLLLLYKRRKQCKQHVLPFLLLKKLCWDQTHQNLAVLMQLRVLVITSISSAWTLEHDDELPLQLLAAVLVVGPAISDCKWS